jgi:hypothetical protein
LPLPPFYAYAFLLIFAAFAIIIFSSLFADAAIDISTPAFYALR